MAFFHVQLFCPNNLLCDVVALLDFLLNLRQMCICMISVPHHTTPHHTITPHHTTPHHTTPHHTTPHVCCVVQIDKTFRRPSRQSSAPSFLSGLLESKRASGSRPYTLDDSSLSSSFASPSEEVTVGNWARVWDACRNLQKHWWFFFFKGAKKGGKMRFLQDKYCVQVQLCYNRQPRQPGIMPGFSLN